MTAPRRTTAVYNPSLLARDELIATFAAREPLLTALVDDLRRGGTQHHLIIGQRGAGKTTLLLRLACAIEDDAELAGRAIPLRFPEEQYNVGRPSDLWLNCVDALIDTLETRGDVAAARSLDADVDRLEELEEDERARQAQALLTGWARRHKRLLVLLVDNLDLVLDRLTGHHWPLREALSADNRLVLMGASSTFIEHAFDYGEAFYDFFNVHELAPLSEPEARAMLERLADAIGAPRVRAALAEPGRFAALHLMSGGMPRTLVLLHRLLAAGSTDSAERDLEALLDQVTPYYKARFDELPAQSQLVVHALAMNWHPMTAIECSAHARLDVNAVSSQLNRLVRQGLVSKLASADSAKLSFLITERLFATWYSMRASRRLRRRMLWYVELLQAMYGQREVERRAEAADVRVRPRRELHAVQALVATGVAGAALGELVGPRACGELWRPFVRDGMSGAVADLLREHGWHERLLPLYEALKAAGEGRTGELIYLAPEVRRPTEALLAALLAAEAAATRPTVAARPVAASRPARYQAPVATVSLAADSSPKGTSPRSRAAAAGPRARPRASSSAVVTKRPRRTGGRA